MPTTAEALEYLLMFRDRAHLGYRRDYIAWFREHAGDAAAEDLQSKLRAKWGKA
jgi:hypothetical protein